MWYRFDEILIANISDGVGECEKCQWPEVMNSWSGEVKKWRWSDVSDMILNTPLTRLSLSLYVFLLSMCRSWVYLTFCLSSGLFPFLWIPWFDSKLKWVSQGKGLFTFGGFLLIRVDKMKTEINRQVILTFRPNKENRLILHWEIYLAVQIAEYLRCNKNI